MRTETWFRYMEVGTGEFEGRLLTPRADPNVYEWPMDFLFDTEAKAREWLQETVDDEQLEREEVETWVLVKETTEVLAPAAEGVTFLEEE